VKHAEEVSLGTEYPEATPLDELERFSIPLATQGLRMPARTPVLKTPKPRAITAPMLEQEYSTRWSAYPGELLQRADGIGKRAQAHGVDDRIEGLVCNRQVFCVHDFEPRCKADSSREVLGFPQHPVAEIDTRQAHVPRIVNEVLARTDRYFENIPLGTLD
jgi:hypothetical protein